MKQFIAITLFMFLVLEQLLAGDCDLAQREYEKGLHAGQNNDWETSRKALFKSVSQCNTFNNWYLLGQVYQELKNPDEALSAFKTAQQYAASNNERALAMARYAQTQARQGEIVRPLTLIHEARKMHDRSLNWMTAVARDLDSKRIEQPLTIAQVTRALTNRSIKIFNSDAKPNVNVNINFKDNSTEIIEQAYQALDILAEALDADTLNSKTITIMGHSDERGTDKYNFNLSEQRAKYIKDELISRNPSLTGRLEILGMGEKFPLYKGHTAKNYLYNRRIELKIN